MIRLCGLFLIILVLKKSLQTEIEISYQASSSAYNPVPSELELIHVAVVTRHGDRAQITRVLSPLHPESSNITSFWQSKLPVEKSFRNMARSAAPIILGEKMSKVDLMTNLYSGLDHSHAPYAQLTEMGASQLLAVGHELRRRYVGPLLPETVEEASEVMFCRSSNICRTIQSLRSLLAGMYSQRNESTVEPSSARHLLSDQKLPYIFTRHKSTETLFPHADGPCVHMSERRIKLYYHHLNSSNVLRWGSLEKRMIKFIGTTHKRIGWLTWLNILDVYTCFQAHGIPFPVGLTKDDLQSITELVGWTWDVLYADNLLSRLAIGRFIREAVDNMDTALNYTSSTLRNLPNTRSRIPRDFSAVKNENIVRSTESIIIEKIDSSDDTGRVLSPSPPQGPGPGGISADLNTNSGSINEITEFTTKSSPTISIDSQSSYDGTRSTSKNISPGTKMLLYSGHDSTMVPLLKAIGLYNGDWPPYASYLTLEVARLVSSTGTAVPHGIVGALYVRAVYNDKDRVMSGCGGQLWCPYEQFRTQFLKTALTNSEYQRECRNPDTQSG